MKRVFFLVFAILTNAILLGQASALSTNDWNSILNNSIYFNGQQQTCTSSIVNNGSVAAIDTSKAAWTSNSQSPYYLEQYVVNILQDIAQTLGVPQSNTVTQEHVVAMIAWAWGEGGNSGINGNNEAFNVWNTSISDPSLVAGGNNSGSFKSFKSFDAGVEANTLSMLGSYQSRIGAVLSNPNTTAEQVLTTIADYNLYPGNLGWTSGSSTGYLTSLLTILTQTRQDYSQMATAEIGPGKTFSDHVSGSLLQFTGGTSNATLESQNIAGGCFSSNISAACKNSSGVVTGNAAILCAAEEYNNIYYFWGGGHESYSAFRSACPLSSLSSAADTSTASNPGPCATDCSGLVSVALNQAFNTSTYSMTVSGAGVMEGSGAQYWQKLPSIYDATTGDIVTLADGQGHVEIVDHISGSMIYTFGSHETGSKTSEISSPVSYWTGGAYRWVGPQ